MASSGKSFNICPTVIFSYYIRSLFFKYFLGLGLVSKSCGTGLKFNIAKPVSELLADFRPAML